MKKIFTLIFSFIAIHSFAQNELQRRAIKSSMNREIIKESAQRTKICFGEKEKKIKDYLLKHPEQKRSFVKDGKSHLLYNILSDGTPVYITTKDINQTNNTKSYSLYSGGSLGVNITGSEMVAGVWDGGQVNENHELLQGQVQMMNGQTLDEKGGNKHMTAVTGIMVGKNINDAAGIAYDAKTFNYDWGKDLEEMDAFASEGYLISNHSYGASNDSTLPVWFFGAYDGTSANWDLLTKSRPFYLPFVAGGNEQQENGNQSAKGFDVITGSSASKNVVTVGSVNLDNTMSNYSNWGPTDDGRIKPDIVTLGTAINVPLYESNSDYTGNVESSSGTSYASPAAAAGALLLQQYYFSLNNKYMPACMLKALLLHTADDDNSGNGPDAKFGWGILNLEKAAAIIKEDNLSDGLARMIMITSNPANNEVDELEYNFTCSGDSLRASLCWIDDEGVEQKDVDGVNNKKSRLVYNFSMKLQQDFPKIESFPYNNLDVNNPEIPAAEGTDWFESANNYLQANIFTPKADADGTIKIRKSNTSPSETRDLALIVSGTKSINTPTGTSEIFSSNNHLFYDRNSNKIRLISNAALRFEEYAIYTADGKLLSKKISNSNEIDFYNANKNIYILRYKLKNKWHSFKFSN